MGYRLAVTMGYRLAVTMGYRLAVAMGYRLAVGKFYQEMKCWLLNELLESSECTLASGVMIYQTSQTVNTCKLFPLDCQAL